MSDIANTDNKRLVRVLLGISKVSRWVFGAVLLIIPLSVFGAPFMPLTLGGDPSDPDARWPTIHIGGYFDEEMSRAALYADSLVVFIYVATGIFVLGQMNSILRSVIQDEPFAADNGNRLRRIGYAGAAAQLAVYAAWIGAGIVSAVGMAEVDGLVVRISPMPWIGVLIAFALSTVFRTGTTLKEEQDLTV